MEFSLDQWFSTFQSAINRFLSAISDSWNFEINILKEIHITTTMACNFASSQLGIENKSVLIFADEGVDQLRLLSLLFIYG